VLDSDWEAEFCRVAEAHPRVLSYVKNHGLKLEVPYRYGSEQRLYLPDFIVEFVALRASSSITSSSSLHCALHSPSATTFSPAPRARRSSLRRPTASVR
jgi:hypothetical protein